MRPDAALATRRNWLIRNPLDAAARTAEDGGVTVIYADYGFYRNEYIGNAVQEDDFPRMAARASRYIDYITQNRAANNAELPAVKLACCALAEQYHLIERAQQASSESLSDDTVEVKSESVGSWSRSYGSAADNAASISENAQSELEDLAYRYLSFTGLLYRGGRCFR